MGLFKKLKNNFANGGMVDDDQSFQLANVPGMSALNQGKMPQAGDPGYNSGVAEKDPLGQAVLDSVGGMGAGALVGKMAPEAGEILGNETGSIDLSALKKLAQQAEEEEPNTDSIDKLKDMFTNNNVDTSKINSMIPGQNQPIIPKQQWADQLATQTKTRAMWQQERNAAAQAQRYKALQNKLKQGQ